MNLGYHVGILYDRYYEIYNMFRDDSPLVTAPLYVYLGNLVGKIFYNLFYPFNYGKPIIVYPDEPIPY